MRGTQLTREVFSRVSLFCVYMPVLQVKKIESRLHKGDSGKKVCGGGGGGALINHLIGCHMTP